LKCIPRFVPNANVGTNCSTYLLDWWV